MSMQLLYETIEQLLNEGKVEKETLAKAVGQELSDRFWSMKEKIKFKSPYNDFNYWIKQGADELEKFLEDPKGNQNTSRQEQGYEKLYGDDDFALFKVLTPDGMIALGDGTSWCIAGRKPDGMMGERSEGLRHYNGYKERLGVENWYVLETPFYYPLQKVCIAVDKNKNLIKGYEAFSQADTNIRGEDVVDAETGEVLEENISVKDFFNYYEIHEICDKFFNLPKPPISINVSILNNLRRVTLLSTEEVEEIDESLLEYDTWWWLRSPGNYQCNTSRVRNDGSVSYTGSFVNYDYFCVRPALTISNLESYNLKIGQEITINDVEFLVIPFNGKQALLYTGKPIYHIFDKESNNYETSEIKRFVENDFLNEIFK